jgi:Zn-dependent peptidase ImmA (M78 family)
MGRISVNINPKVLRWAREESGFEIREIAERVGVPINRYESWESDGEGVPLGKLKSIAGQYKRQLAVFFLEQTPEKVRKPQDYRNLTPSRSKLSRKNLAVLRDVAYFRHVALELMGDHYWKERYAWLPETKTVNSKGTVDWLRAKLGIEVNDQFNWKTPNEAYRAWRNAIESQLGILIFQFPMSLQEIQGFCFTDSYPMAITVNSNHSYTARIFSIFHELAHVLDKQSSLCLWENVGENQNAEFRCNSFAGAFLVPSGELRTANTLEEIKMLASRFKISPEVYLRRLREQNAIGSDAFFVLLKEIRSSFLKPKPTKAAIKIKPEVKSRASRGETFYTIVLDAVGQERISYTRASGLLDLNIARVVREA